MAVAAAQPTFRLLGELSVDGVPRSALGGPKQRALLAHLLLHANELVPRERLVDAVWGESPPPTVHSIVHGYVRKLRTALEGTGARITARSGGYVLELEPEQLDVWRFERLVGEGREALAAGHSARARELLLSALELWRGDPLADLPYEPSAGAEARRLDDLRLEATMDRVDADLALGANGQLTGELESLVSQHPFSERLRGQLMLALYRSGRQADALAAYQSMRRMLAEELGIDPGPHLKELEEGILRHDPGLDPPDAPERLRSALPRAWSKAALAFAVVIATAVVVSIGIGARAGRHAVVVVSNSVAVIDPATDNVVADIPVGTRPGAIAATNSAVWVANRDDSTLSRIDPRTKRVVRVIPMTGIFPGDVAVTRDAVWVADNSQGAVVRVSPALNRVTDDITRVECPNRGMAAPASLAVGRSNVAFVCGSTIARIDANTGHPVRRPYLRLRPSGTAFGLDALWVANAGEDSVSKLDPRTLRPIGRVNVAPEPRAVAVGHGAVWVTAFRAAAVSRLAVAPGSPISSESIPVGAAPVALAVGARGVWVANSGDGTVSRIDPRTRKVAATVSIGNEPAGVALSGGLVWVTVKAAVEGGLK